MDLSPQSTTALCALIEAFDTVNKSIIAVYGGIVNDRLQFHAGVIDLRNPYHSQNQSGES
jgi:hypothetical protein